MSVKTDAARDAAPVPLAEGFAAHATRWARQLGADAATQRLAGRAAAALSLATSNGHVCLQLEDFARDEVVRGDLAPDDPTSGDRTNDADADSLALRAALLASGLVSTPAQPRAAPMILDDQGRLYLHRYFDFERRLAARLMQAARVAPTEIDAATRQRLRTLFAPPAPPLSGSVDWQAVAAALALRGRLTIISGGPGTGKTTTVVNLLACLLAQDPGCRIALAAPTGKAAARMIEAIRERAAHLPADVRDRLPTESSTVHRLLGATPAAGGFVHHVGNLLTIDALVVDEASMLDLALATRLLEAVPASARIILLGDKDQLCAVESGAVFAELSADPALSIGCRDALAAACGTPAEHLQPPAAAQSGDLHDSVVWLRQNFRFAADSGIGRLAADVNGARARQAIDWLRAGDDSVHWLDEGGVTPGAATLKRLEAGYADYLDAVLRDPMDRLTIADAFGAFRALCAVREGPRGMLAINDWMTRRARARLAPLQSDDASPHPSPWFVGRPVMVLRNDHLLKLFNGDIGIALPGNDGALTVFFPDSAGGLRGIAPVRMPEHQTAFAMTVHKAQGSEFDAVLVLLPQRRSPVLTRELLYTAVTRARHRVTLSCAADILATTIASETRRHSGLLARLYDAASSTTTLP